MIGTCAKSIARCPLYLGPPSVGTVHRAADILMNVPHYAHLALPLLPRPAPQNPRPPTTYGVRRTPAAGMQRQL